jgi:23S rRNA pseudouridine1911/1915/1917 synthase
MSGPVEVLFEDAHVIAVSKPAGLLTQGLTSGEPTLEQAVRRHLDPGGTASCYLGTVHRLDRPVSGVVLWAKNEKAARRLAAMFSARETLKEYWAVVDVLPGSERPSPGSEGVWEDWLARSTDTSGVVRASREGVPAARRAVTRYRVERSGPRSAGALALTLWPETGRTHQLRAQSALRGMPVRGDAAYGAVAGFPSGIALHAQALSFEHPVLRRPVRVTAPVPPTWRTEGVARD